MGESFKILGASVIMKVSLFQLLAICCIVSVAASEKEKVNSKRGKILGGTFISPNDLSVGSKTMQVKRGNFNGGSFVDGAFNFKRSNVIESKKSDDKEKRGNINGGSFVGGRFNFKRSNMTEKDIETGTFIGGSFVFKRDDNKIKRFNVNGGSFTRPNFETNSNVNLISGGTISHSTFNGKRKNMK